MIFIFRCDCGRVLYSKDSTKTRKCPCGKILKVKERRVLYKTEDINNAILLVQKLQNELYCNTDFITADKI